MSYIKQDEGGGGDTYNLLANQDGIDVNLNLDAAAGADSQVKLKAGSNITLTEAGTNSISIDAAGGSPGGSNTQVQFNDGGSFGGDADFTFTKTAGAEQVKVSASSSTDLVKITQTGTGNAFLVEDQASPDSTPFTIGADGKVGIGIAPGGGFALRTSNLGSIQAGNTGFMNAGRFTSRSNGSTSSTCFSRDIDQDTGMYFPGTNEVGFSTAGNERLRFGSAGQIGLAGANYGTSGQVLTSGGPGAPVSWQSAGGTSFAQYADMKNLSPTAYPFVQPACMAPFGASCTNQSVSTISDDIHFSPMLFTKNVNIGKLWLSNGGTTNPFEIGVYETDSNNLPTNKIVSATVSSPPSNSTVAVNITSTALTANEMYWIAICNTTTGANLSCLNVSSPSAYTSTSTSINRGTIAITTGTINALPSSITQSDLAPFIRPPNCGVWLI